MKLGSLFSGYGGLDRGVTAALEALGHHVETAWVSDIEPGPSRILATRFPHAPNLGDITAINWADVEPVDIIAGGSPCPDLSTAGRRAGMRPGTRSGLWESMAEAIKTLRPRLVVWENVRGALSAPAFSLMESEPGRVGIRSGGLVLRAPGRVLGDLASLGYDAQWQVIRASDVGAPHQRARLFIVAYPSGLGLGEFGTQLDGSDHAPIEGHGPLLPTPTVGDKGGPEARSGEGYSAPLGEVVRLTGQILALTDWGEYAAAIERWEKILGRPAPTPTQPSRTGKPQLSPAFVEWMMGLPAGWVTGVPGLSRAQQLRALGNGVVPLQAVQATRLLLARAFQELRCAA